VVTIAHLLLQEPQDQLLQELLVPMQLGFQFLPASPNLYYTHFDVGSYLVNALTTFYTFFSDVLLLSVFFLDP
jgi:hypothetical protein